MRTSDNLGTENGEMPYILNSDSFTENIRLFRKHNDGNERSMQSTIGSPLVDTLQSNTRVTGSPVAESQSGRGFYGELNCQL